MNVENLKNREIYLIIDKSGSMSDTDTPTGQTRWASCQETTLALAKKLNEFDPDGITIIPFAGNFKTYPNTTPDKVKDIFTENEPNGSTVLAPALQFCMSEYLEQKTKGTAKANGAMVVVVTDGQPSDEENVINTIVNFTKKIQRREEFGISLLQVGKDKHARDFMKRLDTHLEKEGASLDIVNTKTMDELENITLTEALMASLTD